MSSSGQIPADDDNDYNRVHQTTPPGAKMWSKSSLCITKPKLTPFVTLILNKNLEIYLT